MDVEDWADRPESVPISIASVISTKQPQPSHSRLEMRFICQMLTVMKTGFNLIDLLIIDCEKKGQCFIYALRGLLVVLARLARALLGCVFTDLEAVHHRSCIKLLASNRVGLVSIRSRIDPTLLIKYLAVGSVTFDLHKPNSREKLGVFNSDSSTKHVEVPIPK